MIDSVWLWAGFNLFVLAMLALDLGVFHRSAHIVSAIEATTWSIIWIALALLFNAGIYCFFGTRAGLEFLTGYLIEKALSVAQTFLCSCSYFLIFACPANISIEFCFGVSSGALVMRAGIIAAGSYLIARFHWILYVFGAFLVITAVRMATQDEHVIEPEANPVIRLVRRMIPVSKVYHGQRFFICEQL